MNTATAAQPLTPQQISLRNLYAFNLSSLSRFDTAGLVYVVGRERENNRARRAAGEQLGPRDLCYLRAALDLLEERGASDLVAIP